MSWLLLPLGFVLSLSFSGPVVTGALTGLADGPCPVTGSVDGSRIGLVAVCLAPGHVGLFYTEPPSVQPFALLLDIDPETLGGTWRDSLARSGELQAR